MRAAVYLRQSKDTNGTELAVGRQREILQALCQARGWPIAEEYVDNDVSASKSRDAAEFTKMIGDFQAGKFEVLVANAADRIARRLSDIEYLIDLGIKAVTAQGDLNLATPEGEFQGNILVSFARMEARQKSQRQKDAGLQRAKLGVPKRGPRPFGYEADAVTIRESEAQALRSAYAGLLAGSSLLSISRDLHAAGFGASSGKPYHHATLRTMLRNPRYGGLRGYSTRGSDGKLRTEIMGRAQWDGIVDEETWRAVDSLLGNSDRRKNHVGPARIWLLSGLALCGRCDDGTTVRINYRGRPNADGKDVAVYRCRAHNHLSREASWCDWRVTERVIARLSRPDAAELLIDDDREDLVALRTEESTLRLRLDQLAEAFADGTISAAQLKAGSERLRGRLTDIQTRMVHVDRAPILVDLVTADDVRAKWYAIGLDRQRAVIDLLYVVTLMPRPAGNAEPPLESVQMVPKY
jgi:site-specific DNA recombinase